MRNFGKVQSSADYLLGRLRRAAEAAGAEPPQPRAGLVLGTGLGGLGERLEPVVSVPYTEVPGYPASTVESHAGRFTCGLLQGVPVWLQEGRCHLYEGYSPQECCMGVRVLRAMGVECLVLTNAAGALNPLWEAGELMCIADQINMTGHSPLTGPNVDHWGPRFPDMSMVYEPALRTIAAQEALRLGMTLRQGVYVGVTGPALETPAETRAFRALGGDAIGMSTVLEAMAARHMGMRVLGVSCLTNKNLPDCMAEVSLQDVLDAARAASGRLADLLEAVIARLGGESLT
jgi:purine-nucleoside phosphorylase